MADCWLWVCRHFPSTRLCHLIVREHTQVSHLTHFSQLGASWWILQQMDFYTFKLVFDHTTDICVTVWLKFHVIILFIIVRITAREGNMPNSEYQETFCGWVTSTAAHISKLWFSQLRTRQIWRAHKIAFIRKIKHSNTFSLFFQRWVLMATQLRKHGREPKKRLRWREWFRQLQNLHIIPSSPQGSGYL